MASQEVMMRRFAQATSYCGPSDDAPRETRTWRNCCCGPFPLSFSSGNVKWINQDSLWINPECNHTVQQWY